MSAKKRKKQRSGKFWSGSGKFFAALLIFYLLFLGISELVNLAKNQNSDYRREQIEISGNKIIKTEQILRICGFGDKQGQIVHIDVNAVAKKIMELQFIRGVSVTRRLPKKLNITVEEKEPLAFIYGRGLNLIDRDGYLIAVPNVKHSWDLPLISGIKEGLGILGQKTRARDAYAALEFLDYISVNNPLVYNVISEISMKSGNYFEIFLIRGGANIRVNRDSYKRELFVLKSYMVNYLDWKDLERIDYIDLRFQDQLILRYKA